MGPLSSPLGDPAPRQSRHPERSASQIYRKQRALWRGVEGPRRCLLADALGSFPAANYKLSRSGVMRRHLRHLGSSSSHWRALSGSEVQANPSNKLREKRLQTGFASSRLRHGGTVGSDVQKDQRGQGRRWVYCRRISTTAALGPGRSGPRHRRQGLGGIQCCGLGCGWQVALRFESGATYLMQRINGSPTKPAKYQLRLFTKLSSTKLFRVAYPLPGNHR